MPTVITEGAMAARGFGFGASGAGGANYIEDVFSTYLYTGDFIANKTIDNGIDLATKGGMVWVKSRDQSFSHYLGSPQVTRELSSNTSSIGEASGTLFYSYNSNGFSLQSANGVNGSGYTYASWTFRKQPKFFDIVSYTGTGANRTIAHNLGSTPGCIIVKRTDTTSDWQVYHQSLANTQYTVLNTTAAAATGATRWNSTTPTSSVFSVGTDTTVNASGGTYVAYLFASNAGGFGAAGTDNVITCGAVTTDASGNATVNLGYEPQWLMVKRSSNTGNWDMYDTMRGFPGQNPAGTVNLQSLYANLSNAETTGNNYYYPTSTGFVVNGFAASSTFIYIAIRRGPMKTPTDATKVFSPNAYTSAASGLTTVTTGFPVDLAMYDQTTAFGADFVDRLRGTSLNNVGVLLPRNSAAEDTSGYGYLWYSLTSSGCNTAVFDGRSTSASAVMWNFARAPGFFDEVCYTGNGAGNTTLTHNLGVAPEMIIGKQRDGTYGGQVWHKDLGFYSGSATYGLYLFSPYGSGNSAKVSSNAFGGSPTATTFEATTTEIASSGSTFVAYLFATCPGVSKVGSYTGTGATQTVNCGFTSGARFVMIKRTDSTGDWYVWDTARGMVSGTDPSLLMNTGAAQVNANSVYTATTGFQIVSTAAGINASGGSYIYLAIA